MKTFFSRLSKPELEFLKDNCNFSEEEDIILNMSVVGKSNIQIADRLNVCVDAVTYKKRKITKKIIDFLEVSEFMTVIYVNGKKVTENELKNYEIKVEEIKRILLNKLTNTN